MTRQEFIKLAYLEATRKPTPPQVGTPKHTALIELGNAFIEAWQNEPNVDWNSLWRSESIGNVSATDRFSVDRSEIRKLSTRSDDKVVVVNGDQRAAYKVVRPDQLGVERDTVALVGDELVFSEAFSADSPLIGGSIRVPYYTYAEKMDQDSSEVPVDQPLWLVYIVAADYVRTDPARPHLYGNLVAMAQDVMNSMKNNNGRTQVSVIDHSWSPLSETF